MVCDLADHEKERILYVCVCTKCMSPRRLVNKCLLKIFLNFWIAIIYIKFNKIYFTRYLFYKII